MFPLVAAIVIAVIWLRNGDGDILLLLGDFERDFSVGIEFCFCKTLLDPRGVPTLEGPEARLGLCEK